MKKIIFAFFILFQLSDFAQSPGAYDTTFNTTGTGTNGFVLSMAEQNDGKIVLGGVFQNYNGVAKESFCRINADGSLDNSFMSSMSGFSAFASIQAIAIDSNGKILVGGSFSTINGTAKSGIVRLNSDGSLDSSFTTVVGGTIFSISIQSDNKIVFAGKLFTTVNGVTRNCIARVNVDGSLDTTFAPIGTGGEIYSTVIQPDGKIIVGGSFTFMNGTAKNHICRLNGDGTLDSTFTGSGAGAYVNKIVLQSDGKIMVGGNFTFMNGTSRNKICRLNSDGSVDTTFDSSAASNILVPNGDVRSMVVQPDGKYLIGGQFATINGTVRNYFAKLNSNGTVDTTVGGDGTVAPNQGVYPMILLSTGKLLVGGSFTQYAGLPAGGIVRLHTGITCLLSPPTVNPSTIYYNLNATAAPLTATGTNLLWYTVSSGGTGSTVAPTPNTSVAGLTSYWVSQNDGAGCESGRTKIDVIVNPGSHLKFDGINDYVTISGVNFPNQTYTVEMMANVECNNCTLLTVASDATTTPASYDRTLFVDSSFLLKHYIWTGSASNTIGNSMFTGWHHIAVTSSPTERNLYLDGVLISSSAQSLAPTNMGNIVIGKSPLVPGYFAGDIDELRVWNTTRTVSELNTNKGCELAGNETGLLAYYRFNQGVAGGSSNATAANFVKNNAVNISYGNGNMNNFNYAATTSNWLSGSPIASNVSCASLDNQDFMANHVSLRIFPNPAKDKLTIQTNYAIQKVEIYTMHGQKVLNATSDEVNVAHLNSGVYVVRVEDENGQIAIQKLVKE